jgi:hypothetical protein
MTGKILHSIFVNKETITTLPTGARPEVFS